MEGDRRSVVIERQIDAPPEKLWRALTQPHLVEAWLLPGNFHAEAGHRFTLRNEPRPDVSIAIDCQVLVVEPFRRLAYSWAALGLDSVVTFTLTANGTGTHLRVEQAGFRPDQDAAFRGATAGWHRFLTRLDELLAAD